MIIPENPRNTNIT